MRRFWIVFLVAAALMVAWNVARPQTAWTKALATPPQPISKDAYPLKDIDTGQVVTWSFPFPLPLNRPR